jgi:hypothetical protein
MSGVLNLRLEKDFGEGFKSVPRSVLGIARKNAGWESSEDFFRDFSTTGRTFRGFVA